MKKIQNFILREIAGESIMVPVGKTILSFNGVITLSDTAAFIWKHLEEASDLKDLVQMICREYEIDAAVAASDAQEFIDQLVETGMADYTDAQQNW